MSIFRMAACPHSGPGLDFILRQRGFLVRLFLKQCGKLTMRNRKKYNLPYKENSITSALLFAPAAAILGKIQKTVVKKISGGTTWNTVK
jgi:hypothetical protein